MPAPFIHSEHGWIQENSQLGIRWRWHPDSIELVDEESKNNLISYVRKQLKNGNFSRMQMEHEIGCLPHELPKFLEVVGLTMVWMPMLVKATDKRIPEAMKFEVNETVYLRKDLV